MGGDVLVYRRGSDARAILIPAPKNLSTVAKRSFSETTRSISRQAGERRGDGATRQPAYGAAGARAGSGEAARLEELEMMSLGIEGKRMLWKVLGTRASSDGRLVGFDFSGLERRAESQRRRLEPFRLGLAAAALAG
jgi:hypothetical protein